MISRERLSAAFLVSATLVAMFCVTPSHAETTIWNGSVMLQMPPNYPNHETIQYYSNGCRGDHKDAVFDAFIDVSAYQGKTLRFTPGPDSPLWRLTKNAACNVTINGTLMSSRSTIEWQSSGSFLSITFDLGSLMPGSLDGYRYSLQVCPCD